MKSISVILGSALIALAPIVSAQTSPPDAGASSDVVAIVRGEVLRTSDLDEYWQKADARSFRALHEQLGKARTRMLDGLIAERLIRQEADRQRLSVEQLLEVKASASPVQPEAVRRMYEQSSAPKQGVTLEMARPAIEGYLQQQALTEARRAYGSRLRLEADNVQVYLEPERFDVTRLSTDPVRGASGAQVEIVEFSDFECPFCAQVRPILDDLLRKYAGRVHLVWKDLPLPSHPSAVGAASAARCAGDQQNFWEYHDLLFANQARLTGADLRRYAADLHLNVAVFESCLESGRYQRQVQDAGRKATADGLSATPTVVINGRMFTGVATFSEYEQAILEELKRADGRRRGAVLGLLLGAGAGILQGILTVETNRHVWIPALAAGWGALGAVVGALASSERAAVFSPP